MDEIDWANKCEEALQRAARRERHAEGSQPVLVTMCLFCGKPIERVSPKDVKAGKLVKRWCCIECRNSWSKEYE